MHYRGKAQAVKFIRVWKVPDRKFHGVASDKWSMIGHCHCPNGTLKLCLKSFFSLPRKNHSVKTQSVHVKKSKTPTTRASKKRGEKKMNHLQSMFITLRSKERKSLIASLGDSNNPLDAVFNYWTREQARASLWCLYTAGEAGAAECGCGFCNFTLWASRSLDTNKMRASQCQCQMKSFVSLRPWWCDATPRRQLQSYGCPSWAQPCLASTVTAY